VPLAVVIARCRSIVAFSSGAISGAVLCQFISNKSKPKLVAPSFSSDESTTLCLILLINIYDDAEQRREGVNVRSTSLDFPYFQEPRSKRALKPLGD
jgi:hypothetical protein